MTYEIVPMAPGRIPGFHEALGAIIQESRMYAFLEAPPLEQLTEFVTGVLRDRDPQFVALSQDQVIGWCDVLRKPRPAMRHSGTLGIGVVKAHRRRGVGKALLQTALVAARERGFTRIELFVRTDNVPAKRLYELFGFSAEGIVRRHLLVDDVYRDSYLMSVLYD
jgi:RimJ/RimL family protein N-acetyltransferase